MSGGRKDAKGEHTLFSEMPRGSERVHQGSGGTNLLSAVLGFEAGVDRFYTEGVGVCIPPEFVTGSEDAFFIEAAMSSMTGNEDAYWRRWAQWILHRAGLPAPEDYGERSWTRTEGRSRMTGTYPDTPANRHIRVFERFHTNSAEAWAARIEWRFLTDDKKAGAEVARLVGILRAADVEAKLLPDARTGRKVREGGRKGGTNPKLKRTTTADLVGDWRDALAKKRKGASGGPSAEARWIKRNCETASELSEETIRRYLGRFRKLGQKGA